MTAEILNEMLILASSSPRRKELMAAAGYQFKVIEPDIDETDYPARKYSPVEFAKTLALAKAMSVAKKNKDSLVIGADTIVDYKGQIIGKAADAKQAEQIIKMLFSSPHKVITGLAIVRLLETIEIVEADTTIVFPKKMSAKQIAEHIKGRTWQGKAGAYGIQETGDEFVEKIDGSLTNVMGMPMELLARLLEKIAYSG
jgi:septum formation protein